MGIARKQTAWLLSLALLVAGLVPAAGQDEAEPQAAQPDVERVSRLQGSAFANRRTRIVGANVLVHREDDPRHLFLTSTGDQGLFHVDGLPDGEYVVRISRPGYTPERKNGVEMRFPFRAVVEIDMEPLTEESVDAYWKALAEADQTGEASLHGRISERDGDPLGEIQVRLVRSDGTIDPRTVRSGEDGLFDFRSVPAGYWRVEIQGVGLLPLRQTIGVHDTTELSIALVPQPANYVPSPIELMPPEIPIRPAGLDRETGPFN